MATASKSAPLTVNSDGSLQAKRLCANLYEPTPEYLQQVTGQACPLSSSWSYGDLRRKPSLAGRAATPS